MTWSGIPYMKLMRWPFWDQFATRAAKFSREERRTAIVAAADHALHDGYADLIYIMLPLWQAEFGLPYAVLGLLRGAYVGAMASLGFPAALLSERVGAAGVLALGACLAGLGYCLAGLSAGFATLLGALIIGGLGASAQHPIASSLVARAFAGPRSLKALGTYNFCGDLGKMTLPATLSLMLLAMHWRPALAILGGIGVAMAALILAFTPRSEPLTANTAAPAGAADDDRSRPPSPPRRAFALLLAIGIFDSSTRMGFLLFLPFVLRAKGATLQDVGLAMTLVFAGGAAGKLACTFVGARIGAIATVWLTESLTAAGILALLPLPLAPAFLLLPLIGVALNGTSSVLYGSVPDVVAADWRTRALSIFYTGTIGAGALAPVVFGRAADALGVQSALVVVAVVALLTLPLAALLRPALARSYGPEAA
jgi:MFS transporter, FSR family, fosmidomycin resistance protein